MPKRASTGKRKATARKRRQGSASKRARDSGGSKLGPLPRPRKPSSRRARAIAEILRRLRLEAGVTQEALARRLRKPQTWVSEYEDGFYVVDVLDVRRICRVLRGDFPTVVERIEAAIDQVEGADE